MNLKLYNISKLTKNNFAEGEESRDDGKVGRPTGSRKGNEQQVDYLLEEIEKVLKIPGNQRKVIYKTYRLHAM